MKTEGAEAAWRALHDQLESRQTRIVETIRDYPPPITGCDAQFDHLLEQRDGISRELKRLKKARERRGPVEAFIATSNWIEGDAAQPPAQIETSSPKMNAKRNTP